MNFEGGPNLIVKNKSSDCFSTLCLDSSKKWFCKDRHLYHLLTDTSLLKISNTTFYDYNASIDFFIQNNDN